MGKIATLHQGLQRGHTTAIQLTRQALRDAEALQPTLNAFVLLHRRSAQEAAIAADALLAHDAGPPCLKGIPVAIKDNFDEAGVPSTGGCRAYRDRVPHTDAPAVRRLRQAGAIILGRTNMHELADGVTSENPWYGAVHNPWRAGYHPGGSSGGSAVAVAAGVVPAALGSDTGGSLRIPAAHCGVVGFKPSHGLVPTGGVMPLSTTLDHVGPIASTVADAAELLQVIAQRPFPLSPLPGGSTLRVGVLEGFGMQADPGVAACFQQALLLLERLGATLRPLQVAGLAGGIRLLAAFYQPEFAAWHAPMLSRRPEDFGAQVRADLQRGLRRDPARKLAACTEKARLTWTMEDAMAELDLLVSPTTPQPARPSGSPDAHTSLSFTSPFNITGQPAISIPMGLVGGLPVGLQIIGHRGADQQVLDVAAGFERERGPAPRPPTMGR